MGSDSSRSFRARQIRALKALAAVPVAALQGIFGFIHGQPFPARGAVLGYTWYVAAGWALLCLPLVHKSGRGSALDHLFMATSAISTTGLATLSVSDDYNLAGQVIILALIQLGGIGYMTFGSFVILSRRGTMPAERLGISRTVFTLPDGFRVDHFVRSVMFFTLLIEALGSVWLWRVFSRAGVDTPLWSAVFHSVSAFCTAGFSLYNNSFESHAFNVELNAAVSALSFLGAIGFIVLLDCWRRITGRSAAITLTSRIILSVTAWLTLAGTMLIFLTEASVRDLPPERRLVVSFFQCMAAMTTVGFNTIPIGGVSRATMLVLMLLMIIGASPSGTGGGLKSTTLSAIWGVMVSAARGRREVRFWGSQVPLDRVWTAFAGLGFYLTALAAGTWLLELSQALEFEQTLFEAASALGTVGLSTGVTSSLTPIGKAVVIGLMFCGRVGPLTFGAALLSRPPEPDAAGEAADLAI